MAITRKELKRLDRRVRRNGRAMAKRAGWTKRYSAALSASFRRDVWPKVVKG